MRKIFFIIFIFFLVLNELNGQNSYSGLLESKVFDEFDEPLIGAMIYVYKNDSIESILETDSSGCFELDINKLDEDSYTFKVSHIRYKTIMFEKNLPNVIKFRKEVQIIARDIVVCRCIQDLYIPKDISQHTSGTVYRYNAIRRGAY